MWDVSEGAPLGAVADRGGSGSGQRERQTGIGAQQRTQPTTQGTLKLK